MQHRKPQLWFHLIDINFIQINGDVAIAGNDIDITGGTINLVGSLGGTLGSRIILKNVTYNAVVNGTPGTTVRFL